MPNDAKIGLIIGMLLILVLGILFKSPNETSTSRPQPTANKIVQGQVTGLRK